MNTTARWAIRSAVAGVGAGAASAQLGRQRPSGPSLADGGGFPKFDRDWDRRHPPDGSIACQGNTRVLLFIRHGQYESTGGPGYGRLTDLGREQARMAGEHLVARMRADPALKKAALEMTSSALDRAVETADIIQREVVEELQWVDVEGSSLPPDMRLQFVGMLDDNFAEFRVKELLGPTVIEDKDNLLQPRLEVKVGSRIRAASSAAAARGEDTSLSSLLTGRDARVSVHQELSPVKRSDARFDWKCDGCGKPPGDIHWSDDAETNGLGFCDACWKAGPKHKELKPEDKFSRTTEGILQHPFRMPNDKNLNEADVDTCSVLMPDDPLYKHYGVLNAQILRDNAQINAAFYTHMHRQVNHNGLKRRDRSDVIPFTFRCPATGAEEHRRWTTDEFERLEIPDSGELPWILDDKADKRTPGPFRLQRVGDKDVSESSVADIRAQVEQIGASWSRQRPKKQLEIFVVHQNVIRYMFLRLLQFDTTAWLNLGGSNCTMTQMRITRRGDVICDFFGDHGSKMPVSHYTFNKQPDV